MSVRDFFSTMWKETISFAEYFVTASLQVFQRTLSLLCFVAYLKAPIIVVCVKLEVDLVVVGPAALSAGGAETVALSELGAKCILAAVSGRLIRRCVLRLEVFPSLAHLFIAQFTNCLVSIYRLSLLLLARNTAKLQNSCCSLRPGHSVRDLPSFSFSLFISFSSTLSRDDNNT